MASAVTDKMVRSEVITYGNSEEEAVRSKSDVIGRFGVCAPVRLAICVVCG